MMSLQLFLEMPIFSTRIEVCLSQAKLVVRNERNRYLTYLFANIYWVLAGKMRGSLCGT